MEKPYVLPGQPTRYAREKNFDILHTKLEVELDFANKSIQGKVTHALNAVAPILSIELDAAELKINSAKIDGKDAHYSTTGNKLKITSSAPLKGSFNVEIEYSSTPRKGLYFRGPSKKYPNRFIHAFTQGQAEDSKYWFPCYDYPNMRSTTEMIIKAPKEYLAISNGILVSSKEDGSKKIWHYKQEVPHPSYLVSLIVGEYERIHENHNGVLLEYYVPKDRVNDVQRSFAKTGKMIDFFSNITGQPYPYPKYAQSVVSDFMFGGMENITATTLTEKTLHDERTHLDATSDMLVAHELVHQWFGDYITCRDWSHAWLNEGFANFFAALFREHDEGVDEYQYFLNGYRENLFDEMDEHYERTIASKQYFDPEERFDSHTYEKGAWVLNALRGYMGDELFFHGMRNYVSSHKNGLVETFEFRRAMEDSSGLNLEPFFEQWIFSHGIPEYNAKYSWDEASKTVTLTLEQTNVGTIPLFTTPIEISIALKDGKKIERIITPSTKDSTFYFSVDSEPLNVSIDPHNSMLKKLNFEKPESMYVYQLKNDENAMERVRACWELGKSKSDDALNALASSIDSDKFWGVGLEAASALGKIGTKKALEALLARKNHSHHRVRRGVAIGLRNFSSLEDPSPAIRALVDYLNNEHSYYTRAFAAQSLGYYKTDEAFNALKSALNQESANDQVRYRAYLGLAERKDVPESLVLAIDGLKNGKEYQGRMGATVAIGRLGQGKPEALDALLSMKKDDDLRSRAAAAAQLHKVAEKSAIPEIEKWLASEESGRVRRRLREAIYFLGEGTTDKEVISKLQDDVEKLKSENKELQEKLDSQEH